MVLFLLLLQHLCFLGGRLVLAQAGRHFKVLLYKMDVAKQHKLSIYSVPEFPRYRMRQLHHLFLWLPTFFYSLVKNCPRQMDVKWGTDTFIWQIKTPSLVSALTPQVHSLPLCSSPFFLNVYIHQLFLSRIQQPRGFFFPAEKAANKGLTSLF